jgi:type II secretion system protein C
MKNNTSLQRRSTKRTWILRAINFAGAMAVTLIIIWQTGMMSKNWWAWFIEPKPTPVAKAPPHPPSKALGIAPPTPKGNDSSVSPVPLQLVLVGVQPGRTLTEGSAEIGVVRDSPQTYQAGALLENGARLAEIHTDYVLLQKGGHSGRLYLENVSTPGKVGDSALLAVGGPKEAPSPAKVTTREVLTDYLRPSPVYDGEILTGYQVYPGAKGAPFAQMGLQPGDVIVDLDGAPLSDPTTAWDLLRQLTEGTSLSATVKRHGTLEQITLDGGLILSAEEAKQQPTQAMLGPGNP